MLDLVNFIIKIRPDLRIKFNIKNYNASTKFLSWFITSGTNEYKAIFHDPKIKEFLSSPSNNNCSLTNLQYLVRIARPDVCKEFPLPDKLDEFLAWFYTYGLKEHNIFNFLDQNEKNFLLKLREQCNDLLKYSSITISENNTRIVSFKRRTFGVNLIGYAFGQLGIGEDVRMAGLALLKADVPMKILNFSPGTDIGQNDRSMSKYVFDEGDLSFNIFCLTAEETGRYYAEYGPDQFSGRYNIGYWPWELSRWPKDWEMLIELVDEVWVSSQHTYNSIRSVCHKPLYLMPMAVCLGRVKKFRTRQQARNYFNLPTSAVLFCFSFDLKSYVNRKNPKACLDAFLEAFPKSVFGRDQVGLVVKVHKPTISNVEWNELKLLSRNDARIHIIEQTLDRPELLALYKSCDCFISLHRAEGFGRGIAEAILLGLHVICTGYSGNVDFCKYPFSDLVKYKLVPVKKHEYPFSTNQVWANPDIKHASELMMQFYISGHRSFQSVNHTNFSTDFVGAKYKKRLYEIWKKQYSA